MAIKHKDRVSITIDVATILKILGIVILAYIGLSVIKRAAPILILIFIAFFLALALNPAVSYIAKKLKSQSRIRATGIAYIAVLTILITFFFLVIPPLMKQTADFVKEVPGSIQNAKNEDSSLGNFVKNYKLEKQVDQISSDFSKRFENVGEPALSAASTLVVILASTVAVLVLTFMMLVEGPRWLDRLWAIQPKEKRQQRKETAGRMYKVVTNYVNAQFLIAFIGANFALVALFILSNIFNVSVNVIALAGIVGLFSLLPMIGATIGAVIVVIATLLVSVPLAISMGVYFIIYQQIENSTIQPYIQAKNNNLTPLMVFSAALIGASVAGLLGALVAIPTIGCIKILIEDHYHKRVELADK
ncbi:AI-2E family transporter [Candidatus Saccharibacteria bacterium]|nr:AI-2E family transporter [Candidatus Saccharibacteria bacterium]